MAGANGDPGIGCLIFVFVDSYAYVRDPYRYYGAGG